MNDEFITKLKDLQLVDDKIKKAIALSDPADKFDVLQAQQLLFDVVLNKPDKTKEEVEVVLYLSLFNLLTQNYYLNLDKNKEKFDEKSYENQTIYPRQQSPDIYQIPGIVGESLILYTIYASLAYLFESGSSQ